ncbi:hypothetical protein D3C71_1484910 [compost metagenome]
MRLPVSLEKKCSLSGDMATDKVAGNSTSGENATVRFWSPIIPWIRRCEPSSSIYSTRSEKPGSPAAARRKSSARMPTVTGPEVGAKPLSAISDGPTARLSPCNSPLSRFMAGEPMKLATKVEAGV